MNNDLQKKLGQRIKKLRISQGYSQENLAEELDIAINTLSNIERENSFMTSATLEKIIKVFHVSYSDLFSFDEIDTCETLYNSILSILNVIKSNYDKLKILDSIMEKFI